MYQTMQKNWEVLPYFCVIFSGLIVQYLKIHSTKIFDKDVSKYFDSSWCHIV